VNRGTEAICTCVNEETGDLINGKSAIVELDSTPDQTCAALGCGSSGGAVETNQDTDEAASDNNDNNINRFLNALVLICVVALIVFAVVAAVVVAVLIKHFCISTKDRVAQEVSYVETEKIALVTSPHAKAGPREMQSILPVQDDEEQEEAESF